jgi:hypothetical protein
MGKQSGRGPIAADSSGQSQNDALVTASRQLSTAEQRQREQAARKHGLRANSASAVRVRSYRAGRLLTRLQEVLAEAGRPLQETEIPGARAWAQMEIMATDSFNALQLDPINEKVREQYHATRRLQLSYAKELGLTPGARAALAATVTQAVGLAAQLAQRRAVLEAK